MIPLFILAYAACGAVAFRAARKDLEAGRLHPFGNATTPYWVALLWPLALPRAISGVFDRLRGHQE